MNLPSCEDHHLEKVRALLRKNNVRDCKFITALILLWHYHPLQTSWILPMALKQKEGEMEEQRNWRKGRKKRKERRICLFEATTMIHKMGLGMCNMGNEFMAYECYMG